jgi:hypothetical protein
MNPESDKPLTSEIRPLPRYTSGKDLIELFAAQRLASERLYTGLRNWLAEYRDILQTPPPREHVRVATLIEKAFELSRMAEAKIEIVVSGFKGRP